MNNLWGFHPPFQIDGNFGFSAGIGEMLLQSHDHCIHVLPALPECWKKKGRFLGLKARGNVTVNAAWENGRVCEIKLHAGSDYEFRLQYPGGTREYSMKKGEIIFIDLNGGML